MYQLILLIHVFAAVCIIALVLVQQGRGAATGAAFGSGASQTVFGSRGSGSFLFRVTLGFACLFFATSIILNNLATRAYKQTRVITIPTMPMHQSTDGQLPLVDPTPNTPPNNNDTLLEKPSLPGQIPVRK